MKRPIPVRLACCLGLLLALFMLQSALGQSTGKRPLGVALTSGSVQNNRYINDSLGLQFTPPPALKLGTPELKGNPGTVPLLVTVAAWGGGRAAFYADDLGYYPEARRSTEAYVERVIRGQKQEGLDVTGQWQKVELGGVTFTRVDFREGASYEAVFVRACESYAFVFIFAASDLESVNNLVAQSTVKLDSKTAGCGPGPEVVTAPWQTSSTVSLPGQTTVQLPRLIRQVTPVYPPEAVEKHIEGTVRLNAEITPIGSLQQIEFVGGPIELKDAAMNAVSRWQYTPLQWNGTPRATETRIGVLFSLTKNDYKAVAASDYPVSIEVFASAEEVLAPKHAIPNRSNQPPITDTVEGIQRQTEEVLNAWREGNQGRFQELLDGFAVEDPATWLSSTFGPEREPALLRDYEISFERFKRHMIRVAGYWEKSATSTLHVEYSPVPNPPGSTDQLDGPPVPLQSVKIENFRFYATTGQADPGDWVFSFVYVNGAFRIVGGTHTFWNENWRLKRDAASGPITFSRGPVPSPEPNQKDHD